MLFRSIIASVDSEINKTMPVDVIDHKAVWSDTLLFGIKGTSIKLLIKDSESLLWTDYIGSCAFEIPPMPPDSIKSLSQPIIRRGHVAGKLQVKLMQDSHIHTAVDAMAARYRLDMPRRHSHARLVDDSYGLTDGQRRLAYGDGGYVSADRLMQIAGPVLTRESYFREEFDKDYDTKGMSVDGHDSTTTAEKSARFLNHSDIRTAVTGLANKSHLENRIN